MLELSIAALPHGSVVKGIGEMYGNHKFGVPRLIFDTYLHKCREKLKFSVLVGTAITAKVGIKMQALNLCFILATCFSTFYGSPY